METKNLEEKVLHRGPDWKDVQELSLLLSRFSDNPKATIRFVDEIGRIILVAFVTGVLVGVALQSVIFKMIASR